MSLPCSFLQSVSLDQAGFLQDLSLTGIYDQRALVSGLKRTATLQKQANGAAVLTAFDSYRCWHRRSPLAPPVGLKRL
jgi:hypothetical protein